MRGLARATNQRRPVLHAEGVEGFDGRDTLHAAAPKIQVRNPIGSGDAVTAGVAHALLRGQPLAEALRLGTALGTANCLNLHPGRIEPGAHREILKRVELRKF